MSKPVLLTLDDDPEVLRAVAPPAAPVRRILRIVRADRGVMKRDRNRLLLSWPDLMNDGRRPAAWRPDRDPFLLPPGKQRARNLRCRRRAARPGQAGDLPRRRPSGRVRDRRDHGNPARPGRAVVGVFTGCLVALSSTAIVLKLLADRGKTGSATGRTSLGILVFQDLAIIVMVLVFARRVMPTLLERVALTCSHSLFAAGANRVIREEVESTARLAADVLTGYSLDAAHVDRHVQALRDGVHDPLRANGAGAGSSTPGRSTRIHLEQIDPKKCTHLDRIRDVSPATVGCEECLAMGDTWVHLRLCMSCGYVDAAIRP